LGVVPALGEAPCAPAPRRTARRRFFDPPVTRSRVLGDGPYVWAIHVAEHHVASGRHEFPTKVDCRGLASRRRRAWPIAGAQSFRPGVARPRGPVRCSGPLLRSPPERAA
jgi:hypothetical protein